MGLNAFNPPPHSRVHRMLSSGIGLHILWLKCSRVQVSRFAMFVSCSCLVVLRPSRSNFFVSSPRGSSHQESALRLVSIQLKYGPWRDVFVKQRVQMSRSSGSGDRSGSGAPASARAERLIDALAATRLHMQSISDDIWEESLGKNISYVCGPLAWLTQVGVLKTCPRGHKRRLTLGRTASKRLCAGVPERKNAESMLLRWVGLADACEVQPPSTREQWVAEHERLNQVFDDHGIFKPRSYMRNYTIRALILSATSKRSGGAASVTTARFARAFPDQGGWLKNLPRRGSNKSLQEFIDDLGYDGAPEMLSMFLCLLLTARMWRSPEWYAKHGRALTQAMVEQFQKGRVYRLPLACVEDLRKEK